MQKLMVVLLQEKARLEGLLQPAGKGADAERADGERQLETVLSDIDRLEMYIDRSTMQTFSELLFVDDIRSRVREIQDRSSTRKDRQG